MNTPQRQYLLALAKKSIIYGLAHGKPIPVSVEELAPELRELKATFVTLRKGGELRGCIGTLKPIRPLAVDVAENAFAAAFKDYRFAAVEEYELGQLEIHVSILTLPEAVTFIDEEDLLAQLRPDVDGLIIEEGARRATFLPAVWQSLPNPRQFLNHLKQKAGLPAAYWSDQMQVYRYQVEEI